MFKSIPKINTQLILPAILLFASLIYLPFIFGFFVQDDFFLLSISTVKQIPEIFKFFIPLKEVVWYRPLSSQIFFLLARFFFELNPLYYHLIVFTTHLLNVCILRKFVMRITNKPDTANLSSLIYAVSSIHFIALFWLATYSFTLGVTFVLLTSLLFLEKKYLPALLIFTSGLLTSEVTILVIFPLIFLENTRQRFKTHNFLKFIPFIFLSLLVVVLRKYIIPSQVGGDYQPQISYASIFLIKFYTSRTLGFPMLMEIMPPLLKAIVIALATITSLLILKELITKMTKIKEQKNNLYIFLIFSLFFIAPFLALSKHYSPHYLTFSFLGTSGLVGIIFNQSSKLVKTIFLATFVILQITTIWWTHETHWIVKRAILAEILVKERKLSHPIGSEEYYSLGAGYAREVYNF